MRTARVPFFTAFLAIFLTALSSTSLFAALGESFFLPPHANYQKLKSDHFDVIFPGAYETEATQTLGYLEQAHATLSPYFVYEPGHRTTVILIDNRDSANGAASAVGLQGLILFMVRPDPYQSIGEYEHWLKNLVIHEYAHYLTLEQTRGVFTGLRFVFGNSVFPNHFWPTWLSEGIAVHAESRFSGQGRGYGTYYTTITRDGLYRKKLNGQDWLAYSRLMGPVPDYPFGESYYYAGYGIVEEMLKSYGPDAISLYPTKSAGRVPYFLDGGVTELGNADQGFSSLWESWIQRQNQAFKPELEWLAKNGTPDPRFLTAEGTSTKGSRLSPDGTRVAYVLASGHENPGIEVVDVQTKEVTRVDDAVSGVGLSWSRDGRKLYYAKTEFNGPHALYSDLYEYDFRNGASSRLTKGARAKDPDLCAEKTLVYVTQHGRFSEIRSFELDSKRIRSLYRAPENHNVATPRCTADGKKVYFSEHGTQPLDFMRSVALDGNDLRHEFGGPEQGYGAVFPQPATNGDVYFSRIKDGYYDLARWDARKRLAVVIARSSGGYWLPSINTNGDLMAVSYVSSTGIRTGLITLKNIDAQAVSGIDKAPVTRLTPQKQQATQLTTVAAKKHGYNLLTSLAPRIWSPYIITGNETGQYGAMVLGWDDLDQLSYALTAFYDRETKRPGGFLATRHRISTFRLGLIGAAVQDNSFEVPGGRAIGEERTLGVTLARPFPGTFSQFVPLLVGEWSRTRYDTPRNTFYTDPELKFGAELLYDDLDAFAHSITEEEGAAGRLAGRRIFTNDARAWKALASWQQLIGAWPRHGNISLTGYAAWAPTPRREIEESGIKIGGQGEAGDLNPPLRGYRLGAFNAKRAGVIQTEYRLPLSEFFHGLGNWPLFFRNLGAFAFYDGAKFQHSDTGDMSEWTSGAGAGLLLNLAIGYQAPLRLRLEFAHGFKRGQGGDDIVALLIGI